MSVSVNNVLCYFIMYLNMSMRSKWLKSLKSWKMKLNLLVSLYVLLLDSSYGMAIFTNSKLLCYSCQESLNIC